MSPLETFISRMKIAAVLAWTLVVSAIFFFPMLMLLPWRALRIRTSMSYGRTLSWGALHIVGIRLNIQHEDRLQTAYPAIYVSNHASNLDPFIGLRLSPVGVTCTVKKQIALIPFFGQIYVLSGHILLDRSNRERALASMAKLVELVTAHRLALWIYPEGTQPQDGRLLPFKKGVVHLAVATGLPIVPIITRNAHLLWPARSFDVRPGTVEIEVLEPISTKGWTLDQAAVHLETLRDEFLNHLGPSQHPLQGDAAPSA